MVKRTEINDVQKKTQINLKAKEFPANKHDVVKDDETMGFSIQEVLSKSAWEMASEIFAQMDHIDPQDDPKINRIKHEILKSKIKELETLSKRAAILYERELQDYKKAKETI